MSTTTRGDVLRRLRTEKKKPNGRSFTQLEVAEAIGVREQAVSLWENNRQEVSDENLRKLIDFFGVKPEMLGYEVPAVVTRSTAADDQRWEQLDARLAAIEQTQREILRRLPPKGTKR